MDGVTGIDVAVQLFGSLAALAVVLWFVFRWMKPRLDAADAEKDNRITALEAKAEEYLRARDHANQTLIEAFGDIGSGFETLADDVKTLVREAMSAHELNSDDRLRQILERLDRHRDELLGKLDRHTAHVRGTSGTTEKAD